MQKFHILYNADGSLSWFRAACLMVVALCMFSYAVLTAPDKPQADDEQDAAAEEGSSSNPLSQVFESEEDEAVKLRVQRRTQALTELADRAQFLNTCGNINAGFEGCKLEFSPEVLKFYDVAVEAGEDGFSIVLKAKGDQAQDLCTEFGVNSEGQAYAHDKEGKDQPTCLIGELRSPDLSAVWRRTDDIIPQAAPSGRVPLLTDTAKTRDLRSGQVSYTTSDNRNINL